MGWNPVAEFVSCVKAEYGIMAETVNDFAEITAGREGLSCIEYWVRELYAANPDSPLYQTWADMLKNLELNQYKEYVLFKYGRYSEIYDEAGGEEFWNRYNGFYRECRGTVIDVKNECVVLSPFAKFFNVNELKETGLEQVQLRIDRAECVEFSDKLDGSMQSARWYDERIFMAGSQALDPQKSWRLADGYRMIRALPGYEKMLRAYPENTFIFEYISLKDGHVVQYTKEQEGLYLIGIRNVDTGRELNYSRVLELAEEYQIPSASVFDKTLEQVVSELDDKASNEAEGFVINIDGWRCKMKYNDYVFVHNRLSQATSSNYIIRCIADGCYDDLVSKLPVSCHEQVKRVAEIVFSYIREMEQEIRKYYETAPKSDRKEFMLYVSEHVPWKYKRYCRDLYLGKQVNVIKSGTQQRPQYKRLKDMMEDMTEDGTEDMTEDTAEDRMEESEE